MFQCLRAKTFGQPCPSHFFSSGRGPDTSKPDRCLLLLMISEGPSPQQESLSTTQATSQHGSQPRSEYHSARHTPPASKTQAATGTRIQKETGTPFLVYVVKPGSFSEARSPSSRRCRPGTLPARRPPSFSTMSASATQPAKSPKPAVRDRRLHVIRATTRAEYDMARKNREHMYAVRQKYWYFRVFFFWPARLIPRYQIAFLAPGLLARRELHFPGAQVLLCITLLGQRITFLGLPTQDSALHCSVGPRFRKRLHSPKQQIPFPIHKPHSPKMNRNPCEAKTKTKKH